MGSAQPFRAGDVVVPLVEAPNEEWVIAVYDAERDHAWIAGWPCTLVTNASKGLKLARAATDIEHAKMVKAVSEMRGDHGEGDARRNALEVVRARGGTP